MDSIILRAATRLLTGLILMFSVYLLLRGHNLPGGGFVGGLFAGIAFSLYGIAFGTEAMRDALKLDPRAIALLGVVAALIAGLMPVATGEPFLTGLWLFLGATPEDPKGIPIGTALLFDIGVYLVVAGAVAAMMLALEEEDRDLSDRN